MNDSLLKEAAVECGDEFLNSEVSPLFTPDDEGTHVEAFVRGESDRFSAYLRSYIIDRIQAGDYVR